MAVNRGAIRNAGRAAQSQIRDFTGLRLGNITPTDIDCLIEFRDKCIVIAELKYGKLSPDRLEDGQRLALERLADNSAKPSLLLLAQHSHPVDELINAGEALVVWRREHRIWSEIKEPMTLRATIERFLTRYGYVPSDADRAISKGRRTERPVDGAVNLFRFDGYNLGKAIGTEGQCEQCGIEMSKGAYFRIADGRIMHLECVKDWESRSEGNVTIQPYELHRQPRA